MYKLFGIPNCNTVKKARTYLESKKISYEFVDFKKYTPTENDIKKWAEAFGELPVNKAGLTYRKHRDIYEALSESRKIQFIQENSSLIKRPILVKDSLILAFGFEKKKYLDIVK